ncbi:unnamed protein product [Brachionus calyciflorus]|uniref:MULE transposase domain-containing protein n=1 Tax=Brachionus calyciflorus TaxID=104777 RepID=A0A813PLV7_9BILA|nr:unnamed protein product [Brachionus calyciflorus]
MDFDAFKNLSLHCPTDSPYLSLRNRKIPKTKSHINEKNNLEKVDQTGSINTFEQLGQLPSTSEFSNKASSLVSYVSSESDSDENIIVDNEFYDINDLISSDESISESKERQENVSFEELVISKTTKSKPKLFYNDYEYIIEKKYKDKLYWRCTFLDPGSKKHCKARLHTDENNQILKETKASHIHLPDPDNIVNKLVTADIKDRAKETAENPRRLITEALTKLPRSANSKIYTKSKVWCIDGTFDISPTLFRQLFTINALKGGRNIPLVYAFLCNKSECTYIRLFSLINDFIDFNPEHIFCDFEKAILNAIEKMYPSAQIGGCWFHLVSNLYKNVQSKGLVRQYRSRENSQFRLCFKYLKYLAFLPPKSVIFGFDSIRSIAPAEFNPILEYFEKYYIGLPLPNDKSKRNMPNFPIKMWNVYKRVIKDLPRTNNNIEAWHKALAQDIESHPTLIKLISHLKKEQKLAEKLIDEIHGGIFYPKSKKESIKDNQIKSILIDFKEEELFDFFNKLIVAFDTNKLNNKLNQKIDDNEDN